MFELMQSVNHVKSVAGRGDSKHQSPAVGTDLLCQRNRKEASVAGHRRQARPLSPWAVVRGHGNEFEC